jgi:hypothetical protein
MQFVSLLKEDASIHFKAISNVVNLLLSKQNFTWELKEKIEGLQKDVA